MSEGEGIAAEGAQGNTGSTDGAGEIWFGGFPEELKSNELITAHETPESLAKDYLDKNNQLTELQAQLPQVPESPDAYQFDVPEDAQLDEALVGEFKKFAFENKIPADTANNLVNWHLQIQQKAHERAVQEFNDKVEKGRAEAETALKKEWGDAYDTNVKSAQQVAAKFLPEGVLKYLNDSGFGDNPELVKGFHEISKVLSEDVLVAGESAPEGPAKDSFGRPILKFPSMSG